MAIRFRAFVALVFIMVLSLFLVTSTGAQGDPTPSPVPGENVEIVGTVVLVDTSTLVVDQTIVTITGLTFDTQIQVGMVVRVTGVLQANGIVLAQSVQIVTETPTPSATPAPTMTATPTPVGTAASPVDCALGQGYWKNHPEAWPVESLTLGTQTYTQAELLALLNTQVTGDASLILAHQLIAAELNVANGCQTPEIAALIAQADALLSPLEGRLPYGVEPSSEAGAAMIALADALDAFNGSSGDLPVTVVIEGPVTLINGPVIVIYDINIQLAPDDPTLTVIRIGDYLRVEGNFEDFGDGTLILIAVFVNIVDVDIYVNVDGTAFRDDGDCNNPPPPWANAWGWHRNCGGTIIIIDDDDDGMGMGMGDDD